MGRTMITGVNKTAINSIAPWLIALALLLALLPRMGVAAISGVVYIDQGVTNIGSGKTVRLIVNGSSAGTATTDASGTYSINASLNAGDALLAYIDNDATYKGNAVTISNGSSLSGLDIYAAHLITRQDNGGSLSNANLATAVGSYSDASDIRYAVASNNLTVSGSNWTLYIPTGQSYTPGGNITTPNMTSYGTFNGGSGSITVNGAFTLSGGVFTSTSSTMTVSGNFTLSTGTFTHNLGNVTLTGGGRTASTGATSLNNVTINTGGGTLTVAGTMDVNGNLVISTAFGISGGTLAVAGNVTTTDASVNGSATILFDGGGDQVFSASSGTGAVPGVSINKTGGTLTLQDILEVDGTSGWTYTAGTVAAGASTVVLPGGIVVNAGAMSFNHVTINAGGGTLTVAGTMDVNGNLVILSAFGINGGTLTVAGNLTSSDTSVLGTAAITLDGTGTQTIDATGGADLPNGTLTINKTSGTATLASNLTLYSAGQDLTITAGKLDLAGYNLVLTGAGDVLTVGNGATLQLQGSETITATTKTFNAGSTVIYNGGGTYASLAAGNGYSNLTFNNAAGSWTHTAALTANNLTITAGTLLSSGQNINVSGNWSNSGTYTSGANTVTFNGSGQSITGNTTFNHVTKTVVAADTLTFAAGSTQIFNGTVTLSGASGQLLSLVSATPGTRWNFLVNASATKAISYIRVTDSDASASAAAQKPINPTNSTDSGNNIAWFAIPTVVKSMTIISDPLNNTTNPKAIPGAVIEYTITIANGTGGSTATNIVVTDNLNANIVAGILAFNPNTYAAGQGVQVTAPNINGGVAQNLTNAADADAGDFNLTATNTVTVSGIALSAGQSATVRFRMTVQ